VEPDQGWLLLALRVLSCRLSADSCSRVVLVKGPHHRMSSCVIVVMCHLQVSNGQTVGNKVIDLLDTTLTEAQAVRFMCTSAIRSDVYIRDLAVFLVTRP